MAMRYEKKRTSLASAVNVPFCVGVIVLCLTLFSIHLSGGLFARYTTSVSGDDAARVAKFDIEDELLMQGGAFVQDFVAELSPGESVDFAYQVTNESEVAVRCTLSVVNTTGNIPLTFSSSGSNSVDLAPGCTTGVCEVTATWPNDSSARDYMGMVDLIQISFEVVQVD